VDLRRAAPGGAALRGVVLRGAVLRGVDLGGVDLGGVDLRGVDLRGAVLGGDKLNAAGELASRSDGYEFRLFRLADNALKINAGCRWFTFTEAREHWTTTRGGTRLGEESLAIVDHLERMAKIAGW
jgi:uncharacterized protein YjbI with pentapeptide repeats